MLNNYPCRLCKRYVEHVGFIYFLLTVERIGGLTLISLVLCFLEATINMSYGDIFDIYVFSFNCKIDLTLFFFAFLLNFLVNFK